MAQTREHDPHSYIEVNLTAHARLNQTDAKMEMSRLQILCPSLNRYPMVGHVLHGEITRTMIDSLHLPALRGGLFALLAAALFGISTPLVQKLGA